MAKQRMNLMIDVAALKDAQKITGKKTYSETIDYAMREFIRENELTRALESLASHPDPWWPGYVEEYGPNPPIPKAKRRTRVAAKVVRVPKARRSGTR